MACSPQRDYTFANNSRKTLTYVRDATRNECYTCPCCGHVMIPHMGEKNRWHFKHKSGGNCNYETYLHKIAKLRIRESILKSEVFEISFNPFHVCEAECSIFKKSPCEYRKFIKFNISQFYDICEEEASIDGFRADLLLRSTKYPNEPILIEIAVSHKSTLEKIKSGRRIIEILIKSEEDISNITTSKMLQGVAFEKNDFSDSAIVFYNFNKKYCVSPGYYTIYDSKFVFWVTDEGKFGEERVRCFEQPRSIPYKAHVISSESPINWLWAFDLLQNQGIVNVVNCLRCKFLKHTMYGDRICILYKKYGTPKSPYIKHAVNCAHYSLSDKEEDGTPICNLFPTNNYGGRAQFKISTKS